MAKHRKGAKRKRWWSVVAAQERDEAQERADLEANREAFEDCFDEDGLDKDDR